MIAHLHAGEPQAHAKLTKPPPPRSGASFIRTFIKVTRVHNAKLSMRYAIGESNR